MPFFNKPNHRGIKKHKKVFIFQGIKSRVNHIFWEIMVITYTIINSRLHII